MMFVERHIYILYIYSYISLNKENIGKFVIHFFWNLTNLYQIEDRSMNTN